MQKTLALMSKITWCTSGKVRSRRRKVLISLGKNCWTIVFISVWNELGLKRQFLPPSSFLGTKICTNGKLCSKRRQVLISLGRNCLTRWPTVYRDIWEGGPGKTHSTPISLHSEWRFSSIFVRDKKERRQLSFCCRKRQKHKIPGSALQLVVEQTKGVDWQTGVSEVESLGDWGRLKRGSTWRGFWRGAGEYKHAQIQHTFYLSAYIGKECGLVGTQIRAHICSQRIVKRVFMVYSILV